jgi:DNA-binding NarL/FixJ family response regulator
MIRLLIADDHPIVREGLKRIITECPDIQLVAEAVDGDEVLGKFNNHDIDVLVLDISMPGPGFLEILHRLALKYPRARTLVLSTYPEDHYAIRAIKAGAAGYLTKNHSPAELATAIRRVYNGYKYVSPTLTESLVALMKEDVKPPPHEALSNREYQVFQMLGSGKDTGEIAELLSLSPKTVATYRTRILEKMNFRSKGDIIRYAIEHDLAEPGEYDSPRAPDSV